MKVWPALVLFSVLLLSGCYLNARLYPIQGPASAQTPPPIYAARIAGGIHSGTFTAVLQNGEKCRGTWSQVSREPTQGRSASPEADANIAKAWDAVYGSSFYTAHVLGAPIRIHGVLRGDRGTVLQVDAYRNMTVDENAEAGGFHSGIFTPDREGVAIDNNGNIYKLVF